MGWRFYARRPITGMWLDTDVQMTAEFTESLSAPGIISTTIPAGLDEHLAIDGRPKWLERGTWLYAELDERLESVLFCSYAGTTPEGRQLEFTTLPGALQKMPYDGLFRKWNPTVLEVVRELIDHTQAKPRGDLGLQVKLIGQDPGRVGDETPPARPKKPGRRKGESREHYDDRLFSWEKKVDDWEQKYGARQKYTLAWWEAQMVGAELDTLATEVPFDYREAYRWTDRDALEAEHTLEIGSRLGVRRQDIAFVDGQNLAEKLNPETDLEDYANDVIVLGAGDGRDMQRGRASVDDGRMLTTKIVTVKELKGEKRLRLRAEKEQKRARIGTRLDEARVWDTPGYAPVTSLKMGDEVWVESSYVEPTYGAWRRIVGITRGTADTSVATLRFA